MPLTRCPPTPHSPVCSPTQHNCCFDFHLPGVVLPALELNLKEFTQCVHLCLNHGFGLCRQVIC